MVFAPAILASRELNRMAACRRVISLSLGCCQVPGEGGGCGFGVEMPVFGDPKGLEVALDMALTALVFTWARGWTVVVERVPDMVVGCWGSLRKVSGCELMAVRDTYFKR